MGLDVISNKKLLIGGLILENLEEALKEYNGLKADDKTEILRLIEKINSGNNEVLTQDEISFFSKIINDGDFSNFMNNFLLKKSFNLKQNLITGLIKSSLAKIVGGVIEKLNNGEIENDDSIILNNNNYLIKKLSNNYLIIYNKSSKKYEIIEIQKSEKRDIEVGIQTNRVEITGVFYDLLRNDGRRIIILNNGNNISSIIEEPNNKNIRLGEITIIKQKDGKSICFISSHLNTITIGLDNEIYSSFNVKTGIYEGVNYTFIEGKKENGLVSLFDVNGNKIVSNISSIDVNGNKIVSDISSINFDFKNGFLVIKNDSINEAKIFKINNLSEEILTDKKYSDFNSQYYLEYGFILAKAELCTYIIGFNSNGGLENLNDDKYSSINSLYLSSGIRIAYAYGENKGFVLLSSNGLQISPKSVYYKSFNTDGINDTGYIIAEGLDGKYYLIGLDGKIKFSSEKQIIFKNNKFYEKGLISMLDSAIE